MTSLNEVYTLFLSSSGAITDSRKTTLNALFFALSGPNFDGNTYAKEAMEKGAIAAIVDSPEVAKTHKNFLLVDNVLQTLQRLAKHHRQQFDIPVVGLTGSNGKTTTKELIATILGTTHKEVMATEGNLNNHIGVPLTLLRLTKNHSHAIIEMGANHIGEIDFLCEITQPTHGLITNVGKAHLDGFGSEEGVLKGKTELYRFLEKNEGTVIINKEDKRLVGVLRKTKNITYSPTEYRVTQEQPTLKLTYKGSEINTQLVGTYNKTNIAAAQCVGEIFDVPAAENIRAIAAYTPSNHRSQLLTKNNKTIVLDAYNANPTSMRAAITDFSKRAGKKVLVLGFMAELGTHEPAEHKALVELVTSLHFSNCYWIGDAYKPFVKSNWFATISDLKTHLESAPIIANQVLLKGSRSVQVEAILPLL